MTITYTRANLATKSTMIANPLVENLLSDLGLLGRLSSDSSFLYPAWFQRQRKITDIVVDLGNKSVQSQRLVFSVFEPEGGGRSRLFWRGHQECNTGPITRGT